jgi:hypothetical protein
MHFASSPAVEFHLLLHHAWQESSRLPVASKSGFNFNFGTIFKRYVENGWKIVEARVGVEPINGGFADLLKNVSS